MRDETPESTPALSPEEWALASIHDLSVGVNSSALLDMTNRRHALAALCLYGQPFGFTHEDVAKLRGMDRHDADVQFCHDLASRLAALLPPTADDGTPP